MAVTATARWLLIFGVIGLLASPALAQSGAVDGAQYTSPARSIAPPGGVIEAVLFYVVAAVVVISVIGVCVSNNVVRMAMWLFGALSAVAVAYFLLAAGFLGAIQLIVYVGGTLILLVFGVMLTDRSPWVVLKVNRFELFAAGVVCLVLMAALAMVFVQSDWPSAVTGTTEAVTVAQIGRALLSTYLVPFELAGVMLMIVMVGAAHLARQDKTS